MNEKKNLTTKETFALAVQNHQKNNLEVAENLYKKILKTNESKILNVEINDQGITKDFNTQENFDS